MATMNEDEEPIAQDPVEPDVTHEEEQQQPYVEEVPINEVPRRSQRARKSAIPNGYEVYVSKEIQMECDPASSEEAMRSA